jgi:mannose-6-phosphate isomerase-like protein (cupin superfamily)
MNTMNQRRTFSLGLVTGVTLTCALWLGAQAMSSDLVALAQPDAGTARKNTSRIVLENDRVRVKDATFYPEDTHPGMHTHELPHVGVVIEGGTLKFNSPEGKTETMVLAKGGAGFREANVTHEPINTGTSPVRVIEVELK